MLAATVLLGGCRLSYVKPLTAVGDSFVTPADEQALWTESRWLDKRLEESGAIYHDPGLEAYLASIIERLEGDELRAARLAVVPKVIRDSSINAFVLPDGHVYVSVGMLARVDNEAQLATVLAHETSHFTGRHMLREHRSADNKARAVTATALTFGVAGAFFGGQALALVAMSAAGGAGRTWLTISVTGYSRHLERIADREGLRKSLRAGYAPDDAAAVFGLLKDDVEARGFEEPYFYSTHPRLAERIEHYRALLRGSLAETAAASRGYRGEREYQEATTGALLEAARLETAQGRFDRAHASVRKYLDARPHSAAGYFMLGEVCRWQRADPGAIDDAVAAYELAVHLDPAHADARRELGLAYRTRGRREEAARMLRSYVALAANAADAAIVRGYIEALEGEAP